MSHKKNRWLFILSRYNLKYNTKGYQWITRFLSVHNKAPFSSIEIEPVLKLTDKMKSTTKIN